MMLCDVGVAAAAENVAKELVVDGGKPRCLNV